ncbi:MAG: nucleoside triphosphate pyrophosphohydrolase [Capsulimonadales bacterium]|nr:nucleoside triphosphate pyrophosphohydrolase [Capsulimonadales bacterium]
MLHIVGLGPGDIRRLPPQAFSLLTSGLPVYARTARHPIFHQESPEFAPGSVPLTALDDEYESGVSFDATYDAIVERVLRAASETDLIYAVPGHPLIGETTVARLLPRLKERNIPFRIVAAPSFVDACLEALGEAITDDLHLVDALSLNPSEAAPAESLRTGGPILLYQVHSRQAASDAKLALMRAGYPDDFSVTVVRWAGIPNAERVLSLPLFELDRSDEHDHLTSVWVPPLPADLRKPTFYDLVRVMARLRDPNGGCPWDLEQTHRSLRRYVLEEAYEVAEAIDREDPEKLCEELGDLLLQVVFHAQLGAETGDFDSDDVCAAIVGKLIRRHPHVFGEVKAANPEEVLKNWQAIKAAEKGNADRVSILDGIPTSLPALAAALEVSRRAVRVGFEWPDTDSVFAKVEEELAELRAEMIADASKDRLSDELGDLLFTVVNVGRRLGIEPEDALRRQLDKFKRRFRFIEVQARSEGTPLESVPTDRMEVWWQEAKRQERAVAE